MSDQESSRMTKFVGWGIIGLIVVIGISIALSLYFSPWRTGPFLPFRFGWIGGIFFVFIVFWVARLFFWLGEEDGTGTSTEAQNGYSRKGTPRAKSRRSSSSR